MPEAHPGRRCITRPEISKFHAIYLGGIFIAIAALIPCPSEAQVPLFKIDGQPLILSGSMRTRDYLWNFFNPGPVKGTKLENEYDYGANVLRLGLGYGTHGVKIFAEAMNPVFIGLPDNAIAPSPAGALGLGANYFQANKERNDASIFLKQAYAEFHYGGKGVFAVEGGRFEFLEGVDLMPQDPQLRWIVQNEIQQRLIGNFGWSDAMRSFDGGVMSYGNSSWNLMAMAAVPTQGVFDVDGMNEVRRVSVEYAALNAGPGTAWGESVGRVFVIHYYDGRGLVPVDNQPPSQAAANRLPISIETLGADWIHKIPAGPGAFDVMGWGAYQFGAWGNQSQQAYAYVGEAGYRFAAPGRRPWLRAEYAEGSGNGNSSGGTHGTFFQVLPTPRPYALDPFYNMMNLRDAALDFILDPRKSVEWRATARGLWLSSGRDLWYAGGGAFNNASFGYVGHPSFGHSYLGSVADTGFNWKANPHWSLSLYFGHVFGGPVVKANFNGNHEENFVYLESDLRL